MSISVRCLAANCSREVMFGRCKVNTKAPINPWAAGRAIFFACIIINFCQVWWPGVNIPIINLIWQRCACIGLLPDTYNCVLSMHRKYRERFPPPPTSKETASLRPRHAARHVPWCMSGSLTRLGGENVPGITVACAPQFYVSGKRPMQAFTQL